MKNRKNLIIYILSVVLFLGVGIFISAQDEAAQDQGAEKTHETLKKLPPPALKMLNLTEDEAANTTRGQRYKVYMLGIDKIKAFQTGDKVQKLLTDTREVVFPIYVNGQLKTALSIRKGNGGWDSASIGSEEIHLVEPIRTAHSKANNIDAKSYYIVRVPSMSLVFLGYDQGNDMYLIPAYEAPDIKLEVGKSVLAEQILVQLQPLAEKYETVLKPRTK